MNAIILVTPKAVAKPELPLGKLASWASLLKNLVILNQYSKV
jgi:hypothetical protein